MTMKNICSKTGALSICLTLLLTAGGTSPLLVNAAQEPFVYPAKGQNQEQIDKDKYTCYTWAKGQTGFDPMQQQTTTAPQQKQGGAVKGAAGGAALGAIGGAIGGDAGKGAAIGAATGGLIGAAKRHKSTKAQEQQAQQQAAAANQKRETYNRA